jgi:3-methyladenine DNA glycosylase AlkD
MAGRKSSQSKEVLNQLRALADPEAAAGMARFGIKTDTAFGISVPTLRDLAKRIGTNHDLAIELWESGYHEARILAALIGDPNLVTEALMEQWVADFDSWDVCDGCCGTLFDKTRFAYAKAREWSGRREEFVKRAGFALMAYLAVHDKHADDRVFVRFLGLIKRQSNDDRNFVKKAVNWALRQIGKRSRELNCRAIEAAIEIGARDSRAAKWIAADALRELREPKVRARLRR